MYRGASGARRILQSSHLSAARCGGTTHWSLGDTYLFISKYCTSTPWKDASEPVTSSSSKSSKPTPSALLLQQQHSLSRLKHLSTIQLKQASFRRHFHDYFTTAVTNGSPPPVAMPPNTTTNPPEPSTIVRIPLNRAKQHYGFLRSRGNRPYNEDWSQAGVLDLPLQSLIQASNSEKNSKSGFFSPSSAPSNSVFYYAVFDGHGGDECSIFLKSRLHEYIENTAKQFYPTDALPSSSTECEPGTTIGQNAEEDLSQQGLRKKLQAQLIKEWNDIVGGYFRRFQPNFSGPSTTTEPVKSDIRGWKGSGSADDATSVSSPLTSSSVTGDGSWESILTYAFLRADLDFITGKWRNTAEQQLAVEDGKKSPNQTESGALKAQQAKAQQAKGGSTASVALIFTSPSSNVPYWSPNATSTLLTAHIGDTRILLSNTKTGAATPLTSSHHPSHPLEARRLRRYTAAFMSDSFGEERFGVLANTRAFGDAQQKRLGITAEPEVTRRELKGTEWAFMVLCSDGVSGVLSDQEIVDIVKEAKTPEEGAKAVVDFAEEVVGRANGGGDNSTCMVVRLGGWEKRAEGGEGSKGTRELRKWRSKQEPTARRQ